jgi:CBS domain-containing protein
LSPRAAWRLETLGFTKVFDYRPGKADWLASDLPIEGELANLPRISDAARRDVPTCSLSDPIGEVWERIQQSGWKVCIVTNDKGIVLGRLRGSVLSEAAKKDPGLTAEEVMESGPGTFRPNLILHDMVHYMRDRQISSTLVTTSDGELIGLLRLKEAEASEEGKAASR